MHNSYIAFVAFASLFWVGESLAGDFLIPYVKTPNQGTFKKINRGDDSVFALSLEETTELQRKALNGEGVSARRLGLYYEFDKFDHPSARFWFQISAEDGYRLGQLNFAQILDGADSYYPLESGKDIKLDKERACFWVNKAMKLDSNVESVGMALSKRCKVEGQQ